jgi:hypothetical protein
MIHKLNILIKMIKEISGSVVSGMQMEIESTEIEDANSVAGW